MIKPDIRRTNVSSIAVSLRFSKPSKTVLFAEPIAVMRFFNKALLCSAERAYMDVCTGLDRSMECVEQGISGGFETV
ncbi:MAG TPA: hypothetical protein VHL14_03985 [Steroidobacteraceae bacterium]|jgi:hypothetical protein|nr:hypothetical protein [Steroidobacteraceae bacterium]